jgi:hypothetical protein
MPLPEHIRNHVESNVSESLATLLESEQAAQLLAEFIDGDAVLVFTNDRLMVLPRSSLVEDPKPEKPADTPPSYGMYL